MYFFFLSFFLVLLGGAPVETYVVETIARDLQRSASGEGEAPAVLDGITSIAFGTGSELFVAGDSLQVVELDAGTVRSIPQTEGGDWQDLAADRKGNLYSFDEKNRLMLIRPTGELRVLAASAADEADSRTAMFQGAGGLAVDDDGNVYVADHAHNRIRKVHPDGTVITVAGAGLSFKEADLLSTACLSLSFGEELADEQLALLKWPEPLLAGEIGAVFKECRSIDPDLPRAEFVRRLAEATSKVTHRDGPANVARFYGVSDLTLDDRGNLLVADSWNRRIRKITPEGEVSTLAGGAYGYRDGPAKRALFSFPRAITIDPEGNIYIIDASQIRKIDGDGWVSSIKKSDATSPPGAAERADTLHFNTPTDIACDERERLYVAESGSGALRRLTKRKRD